MAAHEFIVLGTTDNVHTCERCGRTDLKKAVAVAEVVEGITSDPLFLGTSCAAKVTGKNSAVVKRHATRADGKRLLGRFGGWSWQAMGTKVIVKNAIHSSAWTPIDEVAFVADRPKLRANILNSVAEKRKGA